MCSLWGAKMERVSEVLQLPVIVEGRRPRVLEPQLLEKLDFFCGRGAAEGRILKEFLESWLFADGRRARTPGIPSGSFPQRLRDRRRSRVSQAAEVQARAADAPLLLPGVAEPQRPAPFSHPIGCT